MSVPSSDPKAVELSPKQLAVMALKAMQAKLDAAEQARTEPIAVIGMSCRLPGGVRDPESYWRLLIGGTDAITEVPPDRWDVDAYFDPDPDVPGKMYSRWGGFLDEVDRFDAPFFGIAPREAASMDPQQRLLLEQCWTALEDAGINPERLVGSQTGVYVGISTNDYAQVGSALNDPTRIDAYSGTGTLHSIASGRISYILGLRGPNFPVDTACSSSLVAVHLACQALRQGECRMALAGGVNLTLTPSPTVYFCKMHALSADGRCKTFDASADGYVRGEGCGVVVLKRLSDAVKDGDRILATIRGSAVNHDGRSNGLTAPSGLAQRAVIQAALSAARLEPSQVGYIEAHGTGTPLGDPIELQALAEALGKDREKSSPLLVGSAKTNIGHLEAAAGIAGLIKAILCVRNGIIPPHLHFQNPNPHVPWSDLPISVPKITMPWPSSPGHRVAGVSSFGFSGTNAHILVEQAPTPSPVIPLPRPSELLVLSAKATEPLRELAARYAKKLNDSDAPEWSELCSSSVWGRAHLPHRLALTSISAEKARDALNLFVREGSAPGVTIGHSAARPKVAFLCPGQGTQYPGMGSGLLEYCPAFRNALDSCSEILRPLLDVPLREILSAEAGQATLLERTAYAQPALVAMGWASAAAWRSFGVEPEAVMGHSLGEITASAIAGILSINDALKLAVERGRLMEELPSRGVMVAISASPEVVAEVLKRGNPCVEVAAWNGPNQTVIAGPETLIDEVEDELRRCGLATKRLDGKHAFHTAAIEPALSSLTQAAERFNHGPASVKLVSNLMGGLVDGLRPNHWAEHARQPVRFSQGLSALTSLGCTAFVELAPGSTLLGLVKRNGITGTRTATIRRGACEWGTLLEGVGKLYAAGASIDWSGIDGDRPRRPYVSLPLIPSNGKGSGSRSRLNQSGSSLASRIRPCWAIN